MKTLPPWQLLDTSDWPRPKVVRERTTGIYRTVDTALTADADLFASLVFSWQQAELRDTALFLARLESGALELLAQDAEPGLADLARQTLKRHDALLVEERRTTPLLAMPEAPFEREAVDQYLTRLHQLDRDAEARPILDLTGLVRIVTYPSPPLHLDADTCTEDDLRALGLGYEDLRNLLWQSEERNPPIVQDALRLLIHVYTLRHRLSIKADGWSIAEAALRVGLVADRFQVRPHERFAESGHKTSDGGRTGHEKAHGTKDEKQQRWQKYRLAVNALAQQNPKLRIGKIHKLVGKQFHVSAKTIWRHTRTPRLPRRKK